MREDSQSNAAHPLRTMPFDFTLNPAKIMRASTLHVGPIEARGASPIAKK